MNGCSAHFPDAFNRYKRSAAWELALFTGLEGDEASGLVVFGQAWRRRIYVGLRRSKQRPKFMIKHQRNALLVKAVILAAAISPHAASAVEMRIDDYMRMCIGIELGQPRAYENLVFAEASIELHKNVGECGCKLAQIGYNVYGLVEDHEIHVIGGALGVMQSRRALLILSPDAHDISRTQDVRLVVGCAQPE